MPVKQYDELLLKSLQEPNEAAEYLTACYEDSAPVFLQGLRMVVEAHGGIAELAKRQISIVKVSIECYQNKAIHNFRACQRFSNNLVLA